jgi:hypothetical protein
MLNCSCSSSSEGWRTATVEGYFTGKTTLYRRIMAKMPMQYFCSLLWLYGGGGVEGEPNETTAEKTRVSSNIFLYAALHRIIKY